MKIVRFLIKEKGSPKGKEGRGERGEEREAPEMEKGKLVLELGPIWVALKT